ncbi:Peptidyl-prolyl cis-trans isomerase FKBP62 [Morella rubra]|uniref:peptidylprolyl isomerase n=1 Tax=Morella rubra TaxID=262757 RepID=A0A6A1UUM4_9ROSI|nr:Peptidyl-prolyl cis-trans isomerase FKBP62 [Morella rubra]
MKAEKATNVSDIEGEDDLDEEPGEVIESAPPLKVGEERQLSKSGIKKRLLKRGQGWETPELGDEVIVHYVGTLLDGTKFDSTIDKDEPLPIKLGKGQVVTGLDHAIITMKKGETGLFTLPPELGYGAAGRGDIIPPDSVVQFEVELVSWITVVDVSRDSGIIKKIMEKGEGTETPGDLDEVLVKYRMVLDDGTIVAETPEEGIEFYVKDGHLCPAFPIAIKTMKRGEKAKLIVQPQYAFREEGRDASDGVQSILPSSLLNIDLELVSFKPVIDITGDSKVVKKICKEGEGAVVANEGATVSISYIARLEDGIVFEKKGIDGLLPLEFITDEEQVIAGLDRAVATMKKGERAVVVIHPDFGFGSSEVRQDLAVVPPSSNLVYEVEVLDVITEKAPWEMSNSQKIEEARRRKEEGNLLFKNGKYQRAGKKYDKAADYISDDEFFGDDEQKLAKQLQVSCWLNGAACSLKLNDFQGAIKLCSKVLDVECYNVKALYRRAQAFMETADLLCAELDIKKALETDPHNREFKLIQKNLKQRQDECNKRDSKLYINMFAHMTRDTTVVTKKLKVEKAQDDQKDEEALAIEEEKVADSSAPPDG